MDAKLKYHSLEQQRRDVARQLALLRAAPTECHNDWWYIAQHQRLSDSLFIIEAEQRRCLRRNRGVPRRGWWDEYRKQRRVEEYGRKEGSRYAG